MTKNLPASVRARLLNIAKDRGVVFQEILVRYGIERLLYLETRAQTCPMVQTRLIGGF